MKKTIVLFSLLAVFTAFAAGAQKIKQTGGDLSVLKNEKAIGLRLTFDNMSVGKFKSEQDYINSRRTEMNNKEAGKGDKWADSWSADRQSRFEPKFIELFEKYSEKKVDNSAPYTLVFNTDFTEPGYNVGVWRKDASISGTATIVETANPGHVIGTIRVDNVPGGDVVGVDFDTAWRIAEAYAKAGKTIGKFLKK